VAKITYYVKSLERFGASAVVLTSNQSVVLRFPTGDRHASQQTPHQQVVELVKEIAPRDLMTRLERGPVAFEHEDEGVRFKVTVALAGGGMQAVLEAASEPAGVKIATQAPEPAEDLGGEAMTIERTAYEVSDAVVGSSFLDGLLRAMKELGSSDLHLTTGLPPMIRLHGDIQPLPPKRPPLEGAALMRELVGIMPAINREEFEERNDTDLAYNLPGVSRFRVNIFRDRSGPGAVMRAIPFEMPDPAKLGLSEAVLGLCELTKGLVVVTGPTGSGKSTTLAAMIDHINRTKNAHIITIEDPIEFIHPNKRCLINQREIRTHTRSFKDALRAALREDPDIVLVGEMRDLETVAIAVETAETGHLVFGTLHTTTAPSTVDRIVDQFPADRQEQIRTMLSESLAGVIAQVLCKKNGGGRVAAYEVLLGSAAVSNLIREKKTFQLFSVMQTSRNQGMTTLNDSLIDLVKRKLIEPKEAFYKSVSKTELRGLLKQLGHEV
jgi:twitching motility protein PilT